MTPEEFHAREAELLDRLPPELRSAVSWMCYDRGHAYGYEEVLGHVAEMVSALEEPVNQLCERIAKNG